MDLYFNVGQKSGPKFEDGTLDIASNYALVIKYVSTDFEGRIFCEVSDFESGVLYRNSTDVTVQSKNMKIWLILCNDFSRYARNKITYVININDSVNL